MTIPKKHGEVYKVLSRKPEYVKILRNLLNNPFDLACQKCINNQYFEKNVI